MVGDPESCRIAEADRLRQEHDQCVTVTSRTKVAPAPPPPPPPPPADRRCHPPPPPAVTVRIWSLAPASRITESRPGRRATSVVVTRPSNEVESQSKFETSIRWWIRS